VALVDLRGREQEPEVRALLEPDPSWNLVGWSRDDAVVACVCVERIDREEVAVRALAARDDTEAKCLLDAIADVATAVRLVAATDERNVDVFRAAGFEAESSASRRVRLVRILTESPVPAESVRALSLGDVEAAIRSAWARETSEDPDEWSTANPARGQCSVTAMLVRELLGGEILIANVLRDGVRVERHAWNRLPSGVTIDLTRDQFRNGEAFGEPSVEEPVLADRNQKRFATLRSRVRAQLRLDG
jgi:hypothetical protein